jgi:hypothetical protein
MVAIPWKGLPANCKHLSEERSNGNNIETKANVSFDNGIFFDNEAMRTRSIARKKIFEAKRTHLIERNLFLK